MPISEISQRAGGEDARRVDRGATSPSGRLLHVQEVDDAQVVVDRDDAGQDADEGDGRVAASRRRS